MTTTHAVISVCFDRWELAKCKTRKNCCGGDRLVLDIGPNPNFSPDLGCGELKLNRVSAVNS